MNTVVYRSYGDVRVSPTGVVPASISKIDGRDFAAASLAARRHPAVPPAQYSKFDGFREIRR